MSTVVSLINMKGGVGKSTLTFNLAWYCAVFANLRVLAVDLDPQSNLSQYFMTPTQYLNHLDADKATVVEIFEQFSAPKPRKGSPTSIDPNDLIVRLRSWDDGSLIDLIPSRLELAWTLRNPTEKSHLLPHFLSKINSNYDLILIDCAPTESILTMAAYRSSRYLLVPVKPEFLATIGLPLLARSLTEFRAMHQDQSIEMAGIVFNDKRGSNTPPEQERSCRAVKKLASEYAWRVFENEVYHSDSYPSGSRFGTAIFDTPYAQEMVKQEFYAVAQEFLKAIGLK